jgi:hypothetical protein
MEGEMAKKKKGFACLVTKDLVCEPFSNSSRPAALQRYCIVSDVVIIQWQSGI